jgi:hypothetical protein
LGNREHGRLSYALIFAVSPSPTPVVKGVSTADVVYKHPLEIWLDTLRDEYEQDVSRSPLERGVLLSETRTLDTCFAFSEGALNVSNTSASVVPLAPLGINPAVIDIGGVRGGALDPNVAIWMDGLNDHYRSRERYDRILRWERIWYFPRTDQYATVTGGPVTVLAVRQSNRRAEAAAHRDWRCLSMFCRNGVDFRARTVLKFQTGP